MRVGRREFLRELALGALAAPAAARAAVGRGPELLGLRVRSARPFAGDRRLFATLSPRRGAARVSFRLTRPARVQMEAVRTDTIRAGRPTGETVCAVSATSAATIRTLVSATAGASTSWTRRPLPGACRRFPSFRSLL